MAEQERRTTTRAAPTDEPPTPAKSAVAEKGERRRVTRARLANRSREG